MFLVSLFVLKIYIILFQENEIIIGQSPCARGLHGDACRLQLQQTAMSCTSGIFAI